MRRNKPDILKEFATGKNREVGSSLFGFSDRQTLVSYASKKKKSVILFSTMHDDNKVDEATGKPEMILEYNATKAAVDRVDQLCHNYSVQKRTKHWPLFYFYNCLNIAGTNALVIFYSKHPLWEEKSSHRRRKFLDNLGMSLLHPWFQRQAQVEELPKNTKGALQKCGYKN